MIESLQVSEAQTSLRDRRANLVPSDQVIFVFFAYPTPKKVSLKLLNTVSHMSRNEKNRHEIRREVGECTLDEGNPSTLGQIQLLPTGQTVLHLNHNIIPDGRSLVACPKGHAKILQGQRGSPATQDRSQLGNIVHIANRNQERFIQIEL